MKSIFAYLFIITISTSNAFADKIFKSKNGYYFLVPQNHIVREADLSKSFEDAKGILWFMESERKHIFHLSGKRFSLDDEEWTKEKSNKIVLIGKDLDHQTIKKQLSSCRFSTD